MAVICKGKFIKSDAVNGTSIWCGPKTNTMKKNKKKQQATDGVEENNARTHGVSDPSVIPLSLANSKYPWLEYSFVEENRKAENAEPRGEVGAWGLWS